MKKKKENSFKAVECSLALDLQHQTGLFDTVNTNFSNFPFRGWGRASNAANTQRLSCPHKAGQTRPAPLATLTFLLFWKKNSHIPVAKGEALRGCPRGNFPVSAGALRSWGRLSSAAKGRGAPGTPGA